MPESEVYEFEVLPGSWQYFRIYDGCQPTYVNDACLGISAQEIASRIENEGIHGKKRRILARGVTEMSKAMAEYVNSKRGKSGKQ